METPQHDDQPPQDDDQDAGPTTSSELLEQEPEREKAEGEADEP